MGGDLDLQKQIGTVKHAISVTITKDIARYKTMMKEHSELDIIKFENVNPEQSSSSCTKRVSI